MRVAHRENDLLLSRPAVEAALFCLSFGGDRLPAQLIVACADDDDALIIDHDVGTLEPRLPQNRWRNDVSVDVDTRLLDFIPCDPLTPLLDIECTPSLHWSNKSQCIRPRPSAVDG